MINKIISFIFAFLLIFSLKNNSFIIPIDISLGNIPFPYLFWVLLFVYTGIHFKLSKLSLSTSFVSKTIMSGIFFHIAILLIQLNSEVGIGIVRFSSSVYKVYFNFLFFSMLRIFDLCLQ